MLTHALTHSLAYIHSLIHSLTHIPDSPATRRAYKCSKPSATMELDAVKVLLETQERTFRSAMGIVVDELKERVRLVEGTVTDLIKSLEFSQTEVRDLKSDNTVLRKSDMDKQVIIDGLQARIVELERRLNYQEDYSRRNNLRITGLKEQGSETWEQTATVVLTLLQDKLQLPDVKRTRSPGGTTCTFAPPPCYCALRDVQRLGGSNTKLKEAEWDRDFRE